MVLSKEELNKRCLHGDFFNGPCREIEFERYHGEGCDIDGSHVDRLIPEVMKTAGSSRPEMNDVIKIYRESKARLSRKGLFSSVQSALPSCRSTGSEDFFGTFIYLDPRPEMEMVGYAGFDIRVGNFICWDDRIRSFKDRGYINLLEICDSRKKNYKFLDFGEEFVFESDPYGNRVYYILSNEGCLLSDNLEMIVDSKSTTARVGGLSHFAGFSDECKIISVFQPYSFNLKVRSGVSSLSQVFIRYKGSPYLSNRDVLNCGEICFSGDGISLEDSLTPKGLLLRFKEGKVYAAKKTDKAIDMDSRNLDWREFYERLELNGSIDIDKNTLTLIGCKGLLDIGAVCGAISREDEVLSGTGSWGNFAFGIQPFFKGEITAEYYSFNNRTIRTCDKAGVVRFDKMTGEFDRPESYGGDYQGQVAPRLPKMFRED